MDFGRRFEYFCDRIRKCKVRARTGACPRRFHIPKMEGRKGRDIGSSRAPLEKTVEPSGTCKFFCRKSLTLPSSTSTPVRLLPLHVSFRRYVTDEISKRPEEKYFSTFSFDFERDVRERRWFRDESSRTGKTTVLPRKGSLSSALNSRARYKDARAHDPYTRPTHFPSVVKYSWVFPPRNLKLVSRTSGSNLVAIYYIPFH